MSNMSLLTISDYYIYSHDKMMKEKMKTRQRYGMGIGGCNRSGKSGGLSTMLRPGLKCAGLESKFGQGPRPCGWSGIGWSCLCQGYRRGVCFGVPS